MERTVPAEQDSTQPAFLFGRYLILFAALPLIIYLAGFALVRIPSYERWGGSEWGSTLDYAFTAGRQDADVVIFGDSSALFAVDPVQMSRELGLKVINLPNTIGGLPVIGDMALQHYLAVSRRPALIVFYFCVWDLDYRQAKGVRLFEGEEMLVRHGSWRQIESYARLHPGDTLNFPFRVYSGLVSGVIDLWRHASARRAEVVANRGHVANHLPFPPLGNDCSIPTENIQAEGSASVQALIDRYATAGTATMLYLAPLPGCGNAGELLKPDRPRYGAAASPSVFPPADFTADPYYAHLLPPAVEAATNLLTGAVRARLQAAPAH